MVEEREIITVVKAAELLKVSTQAIRNALKKGEIDGFKLGRIYRVYLDSLPIYKK